MKPRTDHDHAIELLKVAVAALGEEIVDTGATRLTGSAKARRAAVDRLRMLCKDAQTLADACGVFIYRPSLLD
jgi:hypothetical protein